jgi:hypothetical protein
VVIPAQSAIKVPICLAKENLLDHQDYPFKPQYNHIISLYSHVADTNFAFIYIANLSPKDWVIPRKTQLGILSKFKDLYGYNVHPDTATRAETP